MLACSQLAGSCSTAPRHRDHGGGALARGPLRLGPLRPCTMGVRGRVTSSTVIAPVPRAAAGPYGRHGASAVRPARPAVMPWPAQQAAAPDAAARLAPAARGAVHWRAGCPYVGAGTRDSPPFCAVDGWEGQRALRARRWNAGPRGCPAGRMPVRADDHGQVQLTGRSQRRATGQDEYFAEGRPLVAELTLTRPIPERRATPGKLHQIRWADRYPLGPSTRRGCPRSVCDDRPEHPLDGTVREDR